MSYGDLCFGMVLLTARGAGRACRNRLCSRPGDEDFALETEISSAFGGERGPSAVERACGFVGRFGHDAASVGDEPCRVMTRVSGSAQQVRAVPVAGASAQRSRSRSSARRSRGMAGGLQLLRLAWLRPKQERRAIGEPERGCSCGRSRRASHSGGCDGIRGGGHEAGSGG